MNHKPVILVADDEEAVRKLFRMVLDTDFELYIATDGFEALEICGTCDKTIDLVFLDIKMPGMNREELLGCLRRKHPRARPIFMSGYPQMTAFERIGLSPDAATFLQKPFRFQLLRQVIENELLLARKASLTRHAVQTAL